MEISQPIIDLVTAISSAYEKLGLGTFTDETYKLLLSNGIGPIESSYQNKNDLMYKRYPVDDLHNSQLRYKHNNILNELEKLMPEFQKMVADSQLPINLSDITSGNLPA